MSNRLNKRKSIAIRQVERIAQDSLRDHPFTASEDPRYCGHWSGSSRSTDVGTLTFRSRCGYPPDCHPDTPERMKARLDEARSRAVQRVISNERFKAQLSSKGER